MARIDDLVLGMDNEEQISASYPITNMLRRRFIRPFFNEEYDNTRILRAYAEIEKADTIIVYGMSLGLSDLTWRNKLIDWIKLSQDNHLILYDYALSGVKSQIIPEIMNIEERDIEERLDSWGVDEVDKIKKQMHMVCGRNIFNIEAAIQKSIEISVENLYSDDGEG